ncbi:MAG: choice-of-anchor L domain-containing protein, partial [Myxococcota bacterium]
VCGAGEDCIAGVCTACDSATTDCDGDGWLVADGDCCDKPGLCGSEPEKVNPGAIEVIGNGIDDNCNNKTDLFDTEDTVSCDTGIASNTSDPIEFAKAMGICRTTTESPPLADKTWGLISAEIVQANGEALTYQNGKSVRGEFGDEIVPLEGQSLVVLSSGIAADANQTVPGPNGGPGINQSENQGATANISTCSDPRCIDDWFSAANPPLKDANALPVAPNCGSGTAGTPSNANDSVMLVLRMRAPTNARAFSFNAYFFSVEYAEYVCSSFNDQFIALVDTPSGTPTPIANPVDKNLMTYTNNNQKWPIGINIASGTPLFAVCQDQATSSCWDSDVSSESCSLGVAQLAGTGFEAPASSPNCTRGGGTFWLTTAGNVIPGEIVEIRIAIWDVGDHAFDSTALIDGFKWLPSATLPGTS